MAGSSIVAMESRKQAASRPRPAISERGFRLFLQQSGPVEVMLLHRLSNDRIEQ